MPLKWSLPNFLFASRGIFAAGALLLSAGFSVHALAENSGNPALDARASAGYFTYKSLYALSNDTGLRYDYQAAIYGGNSRSIGMFMRGNMQSANFALVSKKLDSSALDFIIRMHIGPMYFGPMVGMANFKFTDASGTVFDLNQRHYGGNFGFEADIMRGAVVRLDGLVTNQYDAKEVSNQTIKMGMRMEGDLGFDFKFAKNFGFVVGGKYITYTLESAKEVITMPYGGLMAAFDF